ncbi:diphosphomevalonate decarboxylase [Candidatus Microgenomates bacterium]|nr:MAG: diphosphomevalonate decarboxylase [Candidatus Microgenomates bacterium]
MKFTAKAPANIAFIKYWGKKDPVLRLPLNDSISMNLSEAFTVTTVEFSPKYRQDSIEFTRGPLAKVEAARITKHLDRIRKQAGITSFAKVVTKNSFPKGTGIASSASGFAALTVAAAAAAGLKLSVKDLSILARLGSGSAARSIPDGFVIWHAGDTSENSCAESLYSAPYWDICDIVCVVTKEDKQTSSTRGMDQVFSSPFLEARLKYLPKTIEILQKALKEKNFRIFGETLEAEALNMHAIAITQHPPVLYWSPETVAIMQAVYALRESGTPTFFTIDAGSNVHVLCEAKNEAIVVKSLRHISGVKQLLINKPAPGARIIKEHLF